MKAKIVKTVINGNEEYKDTLYNFSSFSEARKKLLCIKNACKFKIVSETKNSFSVDKGYTKMNFNIEKQ